MSKSIFGDIFNIRSTTDVEHTVETISKGSSLRGFNLWILACSSILASIGLDVNSTAVIIGAMLISPLMSPILGVGLSLGIHDKDLFLRALKNLAFATVLSLLASTIYFLITPLGGITAELEARTRPTLLDVFVAFFGGVAGIISTSRSESNNAIPGVAIATALMPPLCTAGFGLASGNWIYFLGAFYLFFINAVFISLSTYLAVKYLKFPIKQYVDEKKRKLYGRLSALFVLLVMLPSVYFLWGVWNQLQIKKKIESIVVTPISGDGNEILKWDLIRQDSVTDVSVFYSGKAISEEQRAKMEQECRKSGVTGCQLHVMRVNMSKEEITGLSEATARRLLEDMEVKMAQQRISRADSGNGWANLYKQASREAVTAFDFVDSIWLGQTVMSLDSAGVDTFLQVWYMAEDEPNEKEEIQLSSFLKLRLGMDTVLVRRL